jgi:TolA-binding protein
MRAGLLDRRSVAASEATLTKTAPGDIPYGRVATAPRLGALAFVVLALLGGSSAPQARGQASNEVEDLKRQLRQMQENFERVQREQRQQIDALTRKLDELTKQQAAEAEKKKLEQDLAAELEKDQSTNKAPSTVPTTPAPSTAWSPAQPLTLARAGSAYMNISFDVLTDLGWSTAPNPSQFLELGDHDPQSRGFSLPNAEIALDGAVDPYFKGFANIALKLDENNETSIELEEAYAQTISLPANLQAKAGQFYAAFGRQNPQHPHQWAFVDDPIMLTRTFGPDGLRNIGAQLSWLAPTPFYTEAFLGVFNGQGGTAFSFRNPGTPGTTGVDQVHGRATTDLTLRGPGDLLYVPRLASSFDLTDQQTLVVGASAAFGPNETGYYPRSQVYGMDVYWKWKSPHAQSGFPFVSWQTEGLYQIFNAGADPSASLTAETLRDWGFYSQVLWGFLPRWVAGLRGEYANGNHGEYDAEDVYRNRRTRLSPDLTFYPSEFSKIRLQYNYDYGVLFGVEHSVWLQFEFLLGAHAAHKF